MKYNDLVRKVQDLPYFDEIFLGKEFSQTFRNQLSRWAKEGKIIRLKKGLYTLPHQLQKRAFSPMFISNILYPHSYISLEYALSFYDLIPEHTTVLTAISTHKTKRFQNPLGTFTYQSVKPSLFFGYEKYPLPHDYPVLVATPEKALLDKIYFDSTVRYELSYFSENLRLQNFEKLRMKLLKQYAKRINSVKVKKMVSILIPFIRREKKIS